MWAKKPDTKEDSEMNDFIYLKSEMDKCNSHY